MFDPQTRVFTSFFRSDGTDSDKVVGLAVKDRKLELRYGVEYLRYNNINSQRYRQCRPGRFDPATRPIHLGRRAGISAARGG